MTALEDRGDLIRIHEEVDWEYQAVALTKQSTDQEGPVFVFEKMKDSEFGCISGVFGAKRRVELALGHNYEYLLKNWGELESKLIAPVEITGPALCQEVVITGDDVDVYSLPILRHFELDGGRYITAGLQVANDPDTGVSNVSIHRQLPLDKHHLTLFAPMGRHLRTIIERANEQGKPAEIAVVIGADPVTQLASQARAPYGVDEFAIAGGMRGEALEMVKGKTIDVLVPANAEMIIEGVIVPNRLEMDGPFGEYPGTYSEAKPAPVMRVTAITHRVGGYYQNTLTGTPMTENHWMMQPGATAMAWKVALTISPEIKAINVTQGGTTRHHVVVSMKKRHPAEARNVILALLACNLGAKQVIVVDEDIDPFNMLQVEWAVNTRVQPDVDLIVVPNLYSPTLDPSAPAPRTSGKYGFDATMPLGDERRMFEAPMPLHMENWPIEEIFTRAQWSMPDNDSYFRSR
ncbi:MAG: UbiD family decarboxylase [Microbacteriaceae bacterium]